MKRSKIKRGLADLRRNRGLGTPTPLLTALPPSGVVSLGLALIELGQEVLATAPHGVSKLRSTARKRAIEILAPAEIAEMGLRQLEIQRYLARLRAGGSA